MPAKTVQILYKYCVNTKEIHLSQNFNLKNALAPLVRNSTQLINPCVSDNSPPLFDDYQPFLTRFEIITQPEL